MKILSCLKKEYFQKEIFLFGRLINYKRKYEKRKIYQQTKLHIFCCKNFFVEENKFQQIYSSMYRFKYL